MNNVKILLVEDSIADIAMLEEVLLDSKMKVDLEIAHNGEDALALLRHKAEGELSYFPDLILLDLNLPRLDGIDVLKQIKTDPELKKIPVVVLSTSSDKQDILNSYQQHANCFITKPSDYDDFEKVVMALENFWFSIVKLPRDKNDD